MRNFAKSLCLWGLTASVAALLGAAPASAQQIGVYSGHTADGNAISFNVVTDAQGQPALADVAIQFTAGCTQTGSSITQHWHFFFSKGLPIVNGHVKHLENNPQLHLLNSLNFNSRQKVTGTTEARLPVLVAGKPANTVQLCTSAKQAFEATLQSENASPFDHPGTARLRSPERTAILEWSSEGVTHQELRAQP
jgi:hypothetical protein